MMLTQTLRRVADQLIRLPYKTWSFGDSVGFEGMLAASEVLEEDRWLRFAHGFVRAWATRAEPYVRLDCTAPGLAMVKIYRATEDPLVRDGALGLARYLVTRPRIGGVFATWEHSPLQHPYGPDKLSAPELSLLAHPPAGVFVDCLHFDPPFLVALGAVTGDQAWVDEGARQAAGYVRLLQNDSGLFDHFVLEGSDRTYGPGWGRGQGWALLGLLDVLDDLPSTHARRQELADSASRLIAAMIRLQRDDGHWDAVVGEADSGDESSTAAFMAAGFLRAARTAIAGSEALFAGERALEAAMTATDEQGILGGVSAAVNACTTPSHYAHVPRGFVVPWGEGPLALALAARLVQQPAEAG
ncbi:MAG: glycoside hydrolase family 88 protein [Candidatus Dormibacteraeota bacterium]|nr:glycoside hydrolase family 88 protein [Candidatus Dormibacteraeota bacterium]